MGRGRSPGWGSPPVGLPFLPSSPLPAPAPPEAPGPLQDPTGGCVWARDSVARDHHGWLPSKYQLAPRESRDHVGAQGAVLLPGPGSPLPAPVWTEQRGRGSCGGQGSGGAAPFRGTGWSGGCRGAPHSGNGPTESQAGPRSPTGALCPLNLGGPLPQLPWRPDPWYTGRTPHARQTWAQTAAQVQDGHTLHLEEGPSVAAGGWGQSPLPKSPPPTGPILTWTRQKAP